jgi:hypothetical protein
VARVSGLNPPPVYMNVVSHSLTLRHEWGERTQLLHEWGERTQLRHEWGERTQLRHEWGERTQLRHEWGERTQRAALSVKPGLQAELAAAVAAAAALEAQLKHAAGSAAAELERLKLELQAAAHTAMQRDARIKVTSKQTVIVKRVSLDTLLFFIELLYCMATRDRL